MHMSVHPDDVPSILAQAQAHAQALNSSMSEHSSDAELHHPPMEHPDGIDGKSISFIYLLQL